MKFLLCKKKYIDILYFNNISAILQNIYDQGKKFNPLKKIKIKILNKAYKEFGLTINFNKTEFIAIDTDQEFHINIEKNVTIRQVQNFNYLGVSLNKKGMNSKYILNKICKERQKMGA